ncbi:MAG TPA: hypothetical protein VF187_00965 [Gemmatimonadales bacterium]
MTGPPRDWDKEMAEIDKVIARQPEAGKGQGAGVRASGPAALPAPQGAGSTAVRPGGRKVLTAWVRVGLGVAVAYGVTFWPYAHPCGIPLYGYVAAAGGVVLAGLWGAATSWSRRLGLAHVVSLLVTLWGGALLGKAILDRTAYPAHRTTWTCGVP